MEDTVKETVATVGVSESPANLAQVLPQGQGGAVTIVLAAIAVLGGSAGWKFWQNRAKLKHEEAMKKMELDAELAKAELEKKEAEAKAQAEALKVELEKKEAEAKALKAQQEAAAKKKAKAKKGKKKSR